jgi:hypothetical protein
MTEAPQREPGWLRERNRIVGILFGDDGPHGPHAKEVKALVALFDEQMPVGEPDEAAERNQPYRYSYGQSVMQPPFWIVKDGERHLAEVWKEDDAKRLVAALAAAASTATDRAAVIEECVRRWESLKDRGFTGHQIDWVAQELRALKSSPAQAAPAKGINMTDVCRGCPDPCSCVNGGCMRYGHEIDPDPRTDHDKKIDALRSALSVLDTRDPALHRLLAERNIIVRSLDGGSTPFRPDDAFPESEYPREASDLERARAVLRSRRHGRTNEDAARRVAAEFAAVRREAESAGWDDAEKVLRAGHHCDLRVPCMAAAYAHLIAANKPGAATDG